MDKVSVVIPNWNGEDTLQACLDSLVRQSLPIHIIVVENGSVDGSLNLLQTKYPEIEVLVQKKNTGFSEGVNIGIRQAIINNASFVGLFNNDAVADKNWASELVNFLKKNKGVGIATPTFMDINKKLLDSTGEMYTVWGLAYPRGRGEPVSYKYKDSIDVFGASGGASMYRVTMLNKIGLFDRDFFAYYEDVDLSFRAQLAGWKVAYVAESEAYHHIGATSRKIAGFTTRQTMKNLPWVLWKNVPWQMIPKILPRFTGAYWGFIVTAISRGQGASALSGAFISAVYLPKKLLQRHSIRKQRVVSVDYIDSIVVHDPPPDAT
jgi:GT2 family glycosyltransferase